MLLDATKVDDVFDYVRAQTNKIDPVLASVHRPTFVDQLVESYVSDLILFMLETLGPVRAEQFKRTHLGIFNKGNGLSDSRNSGQNSPRYGKSQTHYNAKGAFSSLQMSQYADDQPTSAGGDDHLPAINDNRTRDSMKLPKKMRRGMSL